MRLLIEKISQLNIGWNERPLTEIDLHKLCSQLNVEIRYCPMSVDGFYFRAMEQNIIAVNSRLSRTKQLAVSFHEVGHLLFHAPVSGPAAGFHNIGHKTRQEIEADVFSLCAMFPRTWIENRSLEELLCEEGFPQEMIEERYRIFTTYGI